MLIQNKSQSNCPSCNKCGKVINTLNEQYRIVKEQSTMLTEIGNNTIQDKYICSSCDTFLLG